MMTSITLEGWNAIGSEARRGRRLKMSTEIVWITNTGTTVEDRPLPPASLALTPPKIWIINPGTTMQIRPLLPTPLAPTPLEMWTTNLGTTM